MGPYADQLLADVEEIVALANETALDPLQLANGAKALLDEVATGKITGEEDRYSHTDLWDFAANLEGSQAAVAGAAPVPRGAPTPSWSPRSTSASPRPRPSSEQYRSGDGWMLHDQLTQEQLKGLSDSITALTESVSQVAAVVADRDRVSGPRSEAAAGGGLPAAAARLGWAPAPPVCWPRAPPAG